MAIRSVRLPELGRHSTDATVVRWLSSAGMVVDCGDPIVELKSSGVLLRIGSPYRGRLARLVPGPGDQLRLGHQLALIETSHQGAAVEAIVLEAPDEDISRFAAENKKIFIVHGQNEAKKFELKDFLAKLALDPVILHQQNDLGKTIIEKFEYYASQCAFAIVLLTPDDQTAPSNSSVEGKWRARQNVIMELGWFMAKLGRERVLLLHQGQLEIPSDILGVVYAPFSSSVIEAGETIRERLKGVGLLS